MQRQSFSAVLGALLGALLATTACQAAALVVALGASDTEGKNLSMDQAYPAQLEAVLRSRGLDVQVVNAGVSGDTTADELARFDNSVPRGTRVVILQPGTNDRLPRNRIPPEASEANVEAMVEKAQQLGAVVVLCGFNGGDGGQIARRHHVIFLGNYRANLAPRYLQPDGQHLMPEGYQIVAQRMAPSVARALGQR